MLSIHTSIFIGICAVAVVCLNCAAVVAEFAAVQAGGEVVPGDATPSKRRTARDDVPPHAPQVLSWSPRVVLYPEFLSDEECEYFKHRALASQSFNPKGSGYRDDFSMMYLPPEARHVEHVVRRVEERIGAVTGIPPHDDEEMLVVHRITASPLTEEDGTVAERGPGGVERRIDNVHHDKVNKEFTTATVIVYLEDVEQGGHTVWPCMGTTEAGYDVSRVCSKAYNRGARWHNTTRTVMLDGPPKVKDTPTWHNDGLGGTLDNLWRITNGACLHDNVEGAIRVAPRKGAAVVFHHDLLNGHGGDALAWHTGCFVVNGTKWSMQKFKELPKSVRGAPKGRRR